MNYRIEKDTMGEMQVPADKYWAAQTQRSVHNFEIGNEKMPLEVVYGFANLKKACALVNNDLERLDNDKSAAIAKACETILEGSLDDNFPLVVWQTGSGTQSNMNVNEVVANKATELMGGDFTKDKLVHPNDDVNKGQSSNDTYPTGMRIAEVVAVTDDLIPSLNQLRATLQGKVESFGDVVKIGRTHLQDATPLTLGQEISGYVAMLDSNLKQLNDALVYCREIAIGGTAVGTGLNSHPEFSQRVAAKLNDFMSKDYGFVSQPNKFHALTGHDAEVVLSGALKALAANLMKIANDIRWLASGPRCGLGEIEIPANEPGSSIMPGKVNPTQAEAMTMVAVQVMGNDATVGIAASQGNFELNVFKPVIAYNVLQSVKLLADAMRSFDVNCAVGIEPIRENIDRFLNDSLMLVTALNPHIGYENAATIAKTAHKNGTTLKEEAVAMGFLSAQEFDKIVKPGEMIAPKI
jgi:fumarate hydratase class II